MPSPANSPRREMSFQSKTSTMKAFSIALTCLLLLLLGSTAGAGPGEQTIEGLTLPIKDKLESAAKGVYLGAKPNPFQPDLKYAVYRLEVIENSTPAGEKFDQMLPALKRFPFSVVQVRATPAKMGKWSALVVDGAAAAENATMMHLLSVSVCTDEKIYRFFQVSKQDTEFNDSFAKLAQFQLDGAALTEFPTDFSGEYRLQNGPFAVLR